MSIKFRNSTNRIYLRAMSNSSERRDLPLRPLIICHQLRSPENLGGIARLMSNFGLTELVLSDPQTHDFRGATRVGVGAETVLGTFAVARGLDEALTSVVYAIGTTSRTQF
jgi:tRNA C32,U32 (ribose-2'-O)-methylase TrmJ